MMWEKIGRFWPLFGAVGVILLLLAVGLSITFPREEEPREVTECPECPACEECPTCPECPVCPALPDAVASSLLLFTSPSGPEGFYALTFVHQNGEWEQVCAGGQTGVEEPEDVVVEEFLGRKVLAHLKDNPSLSGTVKVKGADDYVCNQRGLQMICFALIDHPDQRGWKVFTQTSVAVLPAVVL